MPLSVVALFFYLRRSTDKPPIDDDTFRLLRLLFGELTEMSATITVHWISVTADSVVSLMVSVLSVVCSGAERKESDRRKLRAFGEDLDPEPHDLVTFPPPASLFHHFECVICPGNDWTPAALWVWLFAKLFSSS